MKKASKTPVAKPRKKEPPAPAPPPEQTHRQRFEQLLDDAVLGPPKR
jgi:hypothetical protein